VSKLTTDVVTYCTEASNQKSKYAYRKILFYKKKHWLLLITNRKSHTGFRLVPTSMTLNDVIALILRFFHRIRQIFRMIISRWLNIDL